VSTGSANTAKILLRAFVTPENEVIVQVIDNGTGLVQANFKETQLTNMRVGDTADIRIDTFPNRVFRGKVEQLSPASGSQFALFAA
jgi:membrane fusion protein (multidrug efflux system)